jgi:RNA polymerase sigma-70 factor (ECF subfamily)
MAMAFAASFDGLGQGLGQGLGYECAAPRWLFLLMAALPAGIETTSLPESLAGKTVLLKDEPQPEADHDLVFKARNGETDAFERLIRRHYNLVHRVAWRQSGNRTDAEDIAQTVLMQLVERLDNWRGEAKFTTWLVGITINACHDHRRRQSSFGRMRQAFAGLLGRADAQSDADPLRRIWLTSVLSQFDPKLRATCVLVAGEGLSHREAAQQLGISENTVAWRMHEVRKRLSSHTDEEIRDER